MSDLEKTIDISQFQIVRYLDQGSFGQVYEVLNINTRKSFAAKISKDILDPKSKETILNLLREVNINASIIHPAILQFIGFSFKDFQNNDKPVIITELARNESLYNIIDYERRGLSPEGWNNTKKHINIFGIASGMSFLHSKNLLHRDLKLSNILVDDRLFPKISDFGLSKKYHENGFASSTQSISEIKGTLAYLAPEIIEHSLYTPAGDVYAFGFIVFEIMTTEQTFSGLTFPQICQAILNGNRPKIDNYVPEAYRKLIQRCWSQDPKDRPTFDQIVEELKNDDFISEVEKEDFYDYIDFIDECIKSYDKDKKIINIEDIINNYQTKSFAKVSIQDITNSIKNKRILPLIIYSELNKDCKKLVDEAIDDFEKKFFVGKNLIEGKEGFPVDIENGVKYLERSNEEGCIDAGLYLSQMYFKGELIPQDISKSKDYLLKYQYSNDSRVYNAIGNFYEEENNLVEAKIYFEKGAKLLNSESMFKYSLMLIQGEERSSNINEAIRYLNMSKKHDYIGSTKYFYIYDKLKEKSSFLILPDEIQHFLTSKIFMYNRNNNEIVIDCGIRFASIDTEYFFNIKLFSNTAFIEVLKSFSKISIEINYPSESFDMILNKIIEIKSELINDIDTCIFILNSVTSIGDSAFNGCSKLTQISIPSSVTSIGNKAFRGCSSLVQISFEIPSSVTSIGNLAFEGCSSLTQISIPSSVTSIGNSVFSGCSSLTQISIPSSVTSIGNGTFCGCSSLIQITIPSSVISIGNHAFYGCSSLTQISIPSSVTSIGDFAFEGCSSLTQISIPSSVTSIGDSVFSECSSLTQISIHSSVTSFGLNIFNGVKTLEIVGDIKNIPSQLFYGCSSLTQISIPSSVASIGNSVFTGCSSLTQLSIPSSVTSIGDSVFSECSSLTQISIPSSVTSIGDGTFYRCSSLTQISIPSSVTSIGDSAFSGCSSLTQISFKIPSSVTSIGDNAFEGCSSLIQISIPSSVTSIGDYAFYECSSLKPFSFPISVTSVGFGVFDGCKKCNIQ